MLIPKYTRPEAPVPVEWPAGPSYKEAPSTERTAIVAETKGGYRLDESLFERAHLVADTARVDGAVVIMLE